MPTHHAYMETKQTSLSNQKRQNMTMKLQRVEMNISMTTQEPVEQVNTTEVVIITVLLSIQTTICMSLTTINVRLQGQV
jgi:hypothetical protein